MTSLAKCPTHGLWRKSASILLVGPGIHGRPCVLTVKRSSKANFMPNHLVFPGGLCEPSDFSLAWTAAFPELHSFTVNKNAHFPDIFVNDSKPTDFKELSSHVGFRITAIRELVEEAGLLLDYKSGVRSISDEMRKRIHHQPELFCDILQEINAVPDIWSLYNWSTWLTPTGLKHSSRRYDTQFYVVILDSIDELKPSSDNAEVSTVEFWGIAEILMASLAGEVVVAPPQMYELARILNFNTIDELREYSVRRDQLGTERLFPVAIKCLNGLLRVLPGDSLYPEVPDLSGNAPPLKLDLTLEECMELYPRHHRIIIARDRPYSLEVNVDLNLEQAPPFIPNKRSRL